MQQKIEQAVSPITYMLGGATTIWGFNAEQWGIIGIITGIILGTATFCINWYYKHQALKKIGND